MTTTTMTVTDLLKQNLTNYNIYNYNYNTVDKYQNYQKFLKEFVEHLGGNVEDMVSDEYSLYYGFLLLNDNDNKIMFIPKQLGKKTNLFISTYKDKNLTKIK